MASPLQVQLILCDAAQSDPNSGKVHMLGANWSVMIEPGGAHAVAALVKVPWDRANTKIPLHLKLLDSDGKPVVIATPLGPQELSMRAELEVGRPPGVSHGSHLHASLAFSVPPVPLAPGRYEWRLDSGQKETWSQEFQVLPR